MKKNFTLIPFCIILTFNLIAQDIPVVLPDAITFDTTGQNYTWQIFDDETFGTFSIVTNPDPTGVNTSQNVGKIILYAGKKMEAGVLTETICPFIVDTSVFRYISMDVIKPDTFDFMVKLEQTFWRGNEQTRYVSADQKNKWTTLLYDFKDSQGDTIVKLTLFPDFRHGDRTDPTTVFFDNIIFYKNNPTALSKAMITEYRIYPNPVRNIINVVYPEMRHINIIDITGKQIRSVRIEGAECSIDLSDIKPGVYFLRISTEKAIRTAKFIKQ